MFLAIVVACSPINEGDCLKFTDNRGPYLSEDVCIARAQEMIADIIPTLPDELTKLGTNVMIGLALGCKLTKLMRYT